MAGPSQQAPRQSRLAIHNRQRPRQAEETVPSVRVTRATSRKGGRCRLTGRRDDGAAASWEARRRACARQSWRVSPARADRAGRLAWRRRNVASGKQPIERATFGNPPRRSQRARSARRARSSRPTALRFTSIGSRRRILGQPHRLRFAGEFDRIASAEGRRLGRSDHENALPKH
jgi:hypothetical protein